MGRLRIALRELSSLRREKTIVLALVIQLFLAGFSSFLLVGLVSLYDPASVTGGGVTIGVTGEARDDLIESIDNEGPWGVTRYETEEAALTAFQNGHVDAVMIATPLRNGVVDVRAFIPDESVRSTMIVVQVRDALAVYERDRRNALRFRLERRPLPVPDLPDASPTFSFTYTVLLPLLMFLPAFISGSIATDSITEELDAGTFELLLVSPLTQGEIIDGKMGAMIALAPAQAAAWLGLLWVNGTPIANPIPILGIVSATAVIVVVLGTGLAAVFGDRQSAQLVYSLAVILAFLLAAFLPESPPNTIAKLAIGSPDTLSYWLVVGYVGTAVVCYGLARYVVTGSFTTLPAAELSIR